MSVVWTRNPYPYNGISSTTEREEWYHNIGLDEDFDIFLATYYYNIEHGDSKEGINSEYDTFIMYANDDNPGLGQSRLGMALRYVNRSGLYCNNWGFCRSNESPAQAPYASVTAALDKVTYFNPSEENTNFYFDKTIIGDITVWRMTYANVWRQIKVIIDRGACNIANSDENITVKIGISTNMSPSNSVSLNDLNTIRSYVVIQSNRPTAYSYNTGTTSIGLGNHTFSGDYYVQPYITRDAQTSLYLLNGGSTSLPSDTEFEIEGKKFYHLGGDLCVKIND